MRANRLNLVWLEQREAAQGVERERNVKGRRAGRWLLEITVVSGQSCEVTSYGKLQYTDWSTLRPESTVTHAAIPITPKHWASECDRQEQRGEMLQSLLCLNSGRNMSAKGAVQSRTQKHVCTRAHLFIINSVLQTIVRMPVTCQGTGISHVCHLSRAQQ